MSIKRIITKGPARSLIWDGDDLGGDRTPVDVFHSRLSISSDGRYLLMAGWLWHPYGVGWVFDLWQALTDPSALDGRGIVPLYDARHRTIQPHSHHSPASTAPVMHDRQIEPTCDLVRGLVATQFPHWADRSITRVRSSGTDNAIYRLGDDMAVRLPRLPRAVENLNTEQRWLPRLAPPLPIAVPVPLGTGESDRG